MKKIFAAVLFSLLLFPACFAQSGVKYIDAQLDGNKLNEANADLSQIEIDFCGKPGEKAISYTLAPGGNQDICLKGTNASDRDIQVTIGFVDGTVTNDQRKNKACMQQGDNKNFGQYVTGFAASFTIPADNLTFQHARLQLPDSAKGLINGCLVYYTKSVEMGGGLNFSVLMRKAKFIDVNIKPKAESLKLKAGIFLLLMIMIIIFIQSKFKKPHLPPK